MLRLLFRFIGLLCLAGAFAALIVDGTRSVAAGTPALLSLGRTVTTVVPDAYVKLHAVIATHAPMLWDPIVVSILLLPTWAVLGAVGLVLMALTRRRPPKIGHVRR